jgi:hypothetical protein
MKFGRNYFCVLLLGAGCYAQSVQAPATAGELAYFKFMLTALAVRAPASVQMTENALTMQFGLNPQDLAVIDLARQQMAPVLQQAQQATQLIVSGKQALSATDLTALAAVDAHMDQQIAALANGILQSVRPEVAPRLRGPGDIVTGSSSFRTIADKAKGGS